jgi:transaldolase
LLPSALHSSLGLAMAQKTYASHVRLLSAAADAGIDADALAERLQRHGAGAFTADWAALLTAIEEKAAQLAS